VFFRLKPSGSRTYLQLVESSWQDGRTHQRVLCTLGRYDLLAESGQLDSLLVSGSRLSETLTVLTAHKGGELDTTPPLSIGPGLVFEKLWKETGCQKVIQDLVSDRRFEFAVERAVFLTVVHRLVQSGSDRSALEWKKSYDIAGADTLQLQHLYRAMAFLGEELPEEEQTGATPFSPRCVKDRIEEVLFSSRQDLFSSLELVFFDTTSIYFEGAGGQTLGQRGHSKDHRPDLKQMVVGLILDGSGHPVCCEMWPGNTADVTTLVPLANRLKKRFHVGRVCVVADRGMISKETIAELEREGFEYILGARMHSQKEVSEDVLSRAGRYHEVTPERTKKKDPSPLKVKEVWVDEHRYVVCRNEEEARKDAHDRDAIVTALRHAKKSGDKSLVGNKGYRRYLKSSGQVFEIDEEKILAEARYDGKWVLRTNTSLPATEVALTYKRLWIVEALFRDMKTLLQTRPIWHKRDETIRGHVFCTYLALVLRRELEDRLEAAGIDAEWAQLIQDLTRLTCVEVKKDDKRFRIRAGTTGVAGKVFQALRIALSPTVQQLEQDPVSS
jgi:transposase